MMAVAAVGPRDGPCCFCANLSQVVLSAKYSDSESCL